MSKRGMFISLEGIEGVGKSTHMPALVDLLESHKISCVATREPGGTEFGERIREILLSKTQAPSSVEAELEGHDRWVRTQSPRRTLRRSSFRIDRRGMPYEREVWTIPAELVG